MVKVGLVYFGLIVFLAQIAKSACPDGVLDAGEECDDNAGVPGDGCTNCKIDTGYTCAGAPSVCAFSGNSCGNGVLNAGTEQCDDGDNTPFDGCDTFC